MNAKPTRAIVIQDHDARRLVLMAGNEIIRTERLADEGEAYDLLTQVHDGAVEARDIGEGETHLAFDGDLHEIVRLYELRPPRA